MSTATPIPATRPSPSWTPAPRRPRRPRPRWREARRSLEALLADPDDTRRAIDVVQALDPGAVERDLTRFLATPTGRRLYDARSRLGDALAPERLRALPEGSLGRAFLDHLERWQLDVEGLLALNREHSGAASDDPGLRWFRERQLLAHDLWHVLSGYGADDLGEAALLPFSWAQQGGLGRGFLTLGAVVRARGQAPSAWGWARDVWAAFRQGRRAADLGSVPYEDLLAEPLATVRARLGLLPPERAHPRGVPRSASSKASRAAAPADQSPDAAA